MIRRGACLVGLAGALWATPASADPSPAAAPSPAPQAAPGPPVVGAPPAPYVAPEGAAWGAPAYAPPAFYPYPYAPPVAYGSTYRVDDYSFPPPPPRQRHDRGMWVGGVTLVVAGLSTVIAGTVLVATAADRVDIYCDTPSIPCAHMDDGPRKVAGAVLVAGGAVMGAIGVPLWIVGSRLVPVPKGPRPAFVPELRVGIGRADVTLRF